MTDIKEDVPAEIISEKHIEDAITTKFGDRLLMWAKDHRPHQKFPITEDLVWLNRKERRRLARKQK